MMDEKTQRYGQKIATRARPVRSLPAGRKALIWLVSAVIGWALVVLLAVLIL